MRIKCFVLSIVMATGLFLGCQSVPETMIYKGLGTRETYVSTFEEGFQKAQRALELCGITPTQIDSVEGVIVGQFGGSHLFFEPNATVYVYVEEPTKGTIQVEFYARGSYSDKFERQFFKTYRKIISGSSEF
jgi:hypothetical protein